MTALGSGAAYASVEGGELDTWDGVYWALTTMSTVGYGDLSPQTDLGRVLAVFVMVVGIGFLSLIIGTVSEQFMAADVKREAAAFEYELEEDVERVRADLLAEIRAIGERLRHVEARIESMGRSSLSCWPVVRAHDG